MAYNKIEAHPFNFENRLEALRYKVPSEKDYKEICVFLKDAENGKVGDDPISKNRQRKVIDMLTLFFKHRNKSFSKLTVKDLETFKSDLMNNVILKENGKPYADSVKSDCTGVIVQYMEYNYPDRLDDFSTKTKTFRKWFMIKKPKSTPETITEEEVKKLYDECKSIQGKFMIAVLFDSGARIEEFLNIRFEDVEKPTSNFPYYKIDLKEEYSKTNGRKIGMYWENSTEAIGNYLANKQFNDAKEQLFPVTYVGARMFLSRLSKKVLGKNVNPHMLRKSSATYWADKLNRQQLCVRFGWAFSSDMPDVYISRAGIEETRVKEAVLDDDVSKLRKEMKLLKELFMQNMNDAEKEQAKKILSNAV